MQVLGAIVLFALLKKKPGYIFSVGNQDILNPAMPILFKLKKGEGLKQELDKKRGGDGKRQKS